MYRHIVASILVLAPFLSATAEPRSFQEVGGTTPQAGVVEQPQAVLEGQIPARADLGAADLANWCCQAPVELVNYVWPNLQSQGTASTLPAHLL